MIPKGGFRASSVLDVCGLYSLPGNEDESEDDFTKDQWPPDLKALDTIGNCQRPVFSLGASQHMHKITNL